MSNRPTQIRARDTSGQLYVLADVLNPSTAHCASCRAELQRSSTGDLTDGVRAHYRTVHPEKGLT